METVRENVFNLDQGKRASSHQGQPRSLGCDSGFIEICNVPHRIGVACLCLHERDLTPRVPVSHALSWRDSVMMVISPELTLLEPPRASKSIRNSKLNPNATSDA